MGADRRIESRGSAVVRALATLARASYADAAPTDEERDAWRDIVHAAKVEHDRLRALVRALEQCITWNDSTQRYELYQRVRDYLPDAREVGR